MTPKTGWPPGMLQDYDSRLSRWLASRPGARHQVRKNIMEMTDKQPDAPTQCRLKELFDYKDGQLINKTIRRSQIKVGQPAGGIDFRGYVKVRVDGRMYRAHRLIFLYHHGYFPEIVDHIDCNRANNRIENLRGCNKSENGMNRAGSYGKTSARNVYQRGKKFQVHLKRNGRPIYIGTFETLEAANQAAEAARLQFFGEFA